MGKWDTTNRTLAIAAESSPGAGTFSDWQEMKPGETAHIHVERTDGGGSDYLVELYGSPDGGTKISGVPLLSYRFNTSDRTKDIIVSGLFSWRIKLTGLGASAVAGSVNYRLDNVSLG